jgi:hypothetical protein
MFRSANLCDTCDRPTSNGAHYGEYQCDDCAEAAYERFCESFHDGGATSFKTLQQQQIEARRLK